MGGSNNAARIAAWAHLGNGIGIGISIGPPKLELGEWAVQGIEGICFPLKADRDLLLLMQELTAAKYHNVREALKIMESTTGDELLSFSDVDAYREEGVQYILRRVKALPHTLKASE